VAASAALGSPSATRAADVVSGQVHIALGPRRRNRLRHHYYYDPGRTAVRTMVREIAGRWDVSPHLALAIAWQESGWQQNVRSSSGAIGIMQVLPSTGRWVDDYLVDRDLDIRRSTDNVAAGVAFLRWLLDTARLYRRSIAGYYQGLASVRRNNMFDDTRAYVRSVQALRYRSRHGGILG
jgi:soluble lytic murein transglycosylase-like protein